MKKWHNDELYYFASLAPVQIHSWRNKGICPLGKVLSKFEKNSQDPVRKWPSCPFFSSIILEHQLLAI